MHSLLGLFPKLSEEKQWKVFHLALRKEWLEHLPLFSSHFQSIDDYSDFYKCTFWARTVAAKELMSDYLFQYNQSLSGNYSSRYLQDLIKQGNVQLGLKQTKRYIHLLDEYNFVRFALGQPCWEILDLFSFISSDSYSLILKAAAKDHKQKWLEKALLYTTDHDHEDALGKAILSQNEKGVETLLPYLDLRSLNRENHPLTIAARKGHVDIFKLVAQASGIKSSDNTHHFTELLDDALMVAIEGGHLDIVKAFQFSLDDDHFKHAILHHQDPIVDLYIQKIEELPAHKEFVQVDFDVLETAAQKGNIKALDHCLNYRKNTESNLNLIMEKAIKAGHLHALKLIILHSSEVRWGKNLKVASEHNQKEIVEWMLQHHDYSQKHLKKAWAKAMSFQYYDLAERLKPKKPVKNHVWERCFDSLINSQDHYNLEPFLKQHAFSDPFIYSKITSLTKRLDYKKAKPRVLQLLHWVDPNTDNCLALKFAAYYSCEDEMRRLFPLSDLKNNHANIAFWMMMSENRNIDLIAEYFPLLDLKKYGLEALQGLKRHGQNTYNKHDIQKICDFIFPHLDPAENNFEPLRLAVYFGLEKWVEHFIPLSQVDVHHSLALRIAIEKKFKEIVELLIPHSKVDDLNSLALKNCLHPRDGIDDEVILSKLIPGLDIKGLDKKLQQHKRFKKALLLAQKKDIEDATPLVEGEKVIRRL